MTKLDVRDWLGDSAELTRPDAKVAPAARPAAVAAWHEQRVALYGDLFGQGFTLPGGASEILRLMRPVAPAAGANLMVVGCGVAGPAGVLSAKLGLLVRGYETIPALAGLAGGALGDGPPPVISVWTPTRPSLPRRQFHHALALCPLEGGPAEPVMAAIAEAIKPSGQLIMVDLVCTPSFDPDGEDGANWLRLEQRVAPVPQQELTRVIARLGLQLRSTEDLSRHHMRSAVHDWRRLVDGIVGCPASERGALLLNDAERWLLRARLLQRGELKLMRWHAARIA